MKNLDKYALKQAFISLALVLGAFLLFFVVVAAILAIIWIIPFKVSMAILIAIFVLAIAYSFVKSEYNYYSKYEKFGDD